MRLAAIFSCEGHLAAFLHRNLMRTHALESEFLKILTDRDCGGKLSRFEDWAACRSRRDVERTLNLFAGGKFTKPQKASSANTNESTGSPHPGGTSGNESTRALPC